MNKYISKHMGKCLAFSLNRNRRSPLKDRRQTLLTDTSKWSPLLKNKSPYVDQYSLEKKIILIIYESTDHPRGHKCIWPSKKNNDNLKHFLAYNHGCLMLAEAIYQSSTLSVKYHILSRCSVSTWVSTSLSVLTWRFRFGVWIMRGSTLDASPLQGWDAPRGPRLCPTLSGWVSGCGAAPPARHRSTPFSRHTLYELDFLNGWNSPWTSAWLESSSMLPWLQRPSGTKGASAAARASLVAGRGSLGPFVTNAVVWWGLVRDRRIPDSTPGGWGVQWGTCSRGGRGPRRLIP